MEYFETLRFLSITWKQKSSIKGLEVGFNYFIFVVFVYDLTFKRYEFDATDTTVSSLIFASLWKLHIC